MRKFADISIEKEKSDVFRYNAGKILRNQKFLNLVRFFLLLLTIYAILWGLFSPKNEFTTGLFWGLFWPFFMVITLPFVGNVFCMICPNGFISRKIENIGLKKRIPKFLKNPYIGLGLLIVFYWFILYTFPGTFRNSFNTALLFLFFTLLAVFVSFLFRDGVYCRYFCPIVRVAPAFARVGFMWLSSYKRICGEKCNKPDCAFSCPYKLNPSKFEEKNSMSTCTLCMECANSCESIKYSIKDWSYSLKRKIKQPQSWEIWVYITLLAVITVTMRFHHGLGHSPIKDSLPWVIAGKWLHQITGIGKPVDFVGLMALLSGISITLTLVLGGFYISSLILKRKFKEIFLNLGYTLAPLVIIGSLSHVSHFFFTHYFHEIVNGFAQAFFLDIHVQPLADRKDTWLRVFYVFPFIAAFWSGYLMWRRISFFEISGFKKFAGYLAASSIVWFYLLLTVVQLYLRYF